MLADALAYADAVLEPGSHGRPGHADRRGPGGAGQRSRGALYATDDELAAALLDAGARQRGPAVADAAGGGLRGCPGLPRRGPGQRGPGRRRGPDPSTPRCSCASSPAAAPGPTWTSRARPGPPSDDGENTKGATGFGTRLLLRWLAGSPARTVIGKAAGCDGDAGWRATPRLTAASSPSPTGSSSGTSRSSCRDLARRRLPDGGGARVVAGCGSATRPPASALSNATTPPGRSSRSAGDQVVGVLLLVGVAEHQVVGAVGEPGQHVEGLAR